ncbi:cytosine permease [Shewanella olleyana]|uniref:cytosine permease n=1 Tax=Shewanella olleyana TaxID=135626 RepID=UPI0020104AC5|nr:cytosine permease [Shewanella olleyana]MCL1068580.1 cytosine permease [Shewanella olleyana]
MSVNQPVQPNSQSSPTQLNKAQSNTAKSNELESSFDGLLDDYATSPVPSNKTVGGIRIGMINGGLAFAVPGLITGLELGGALGITQSIYAFLIGGVILSVLGAVTGLVGMHNRLASCMTMKFVFGTKGANLLTLAFVLSLLGWYGVNINLFSEVSQSLIMQMFNLTVPIWALEISAGILITLTTIWGFSLIEKVSSLFVPVLFLLTAYMLYKSFGYVIPTTALPANHIDTISLSFGEAVSAVVGSFIVSVVLMPDFTRFAKTKTDTVVASFLPFLLLNTFVYIAAAMAGLAVQQNDILQVMLTLGIGTLAFVLLIMSSWVTNVVNLYSAALGFNAINANWKEWKIIVVAGVLGTVVASFNLLANFTDFLFSLSIIFTPVAAIYVVDFFILRSQKTYQLAQIAHLPAINYLAVIAWAIGISTSLLVNNGYFTFTGIEVCDAIIITMPSYYLLMKIWQKNRLSRST